MAITSTVASPAAKKPAILPMQDPNNPNQALQINANQVQPVAAAQPAQSAGVMAAGQSLEQVNRMAQQGFQSPTVAATSLKTQELLNDPSQGQNYQQNINNRLTQADRENAQALETARQGMAGAAGSSINQQSLMQLALQNNEKKSDLQTTLEAQASEQKQKAMLAALAEGRSTSQLEQNQYNTNIEALVKARGAADTEMGLTQKTSSEALDRGLEIAKTNQNANLQMALANIDSATKQGLQANQQDWDTANNELDRAATTALQNGDTAAQITIAKLKGEIDAAQQSSQRQWNTAERLATQIYSSNERIESQDYNTATKFIDQQIEAQARAQEFSNDIFLQVSQFGQEKVMADIDAKIAEAKSGNDYKRTEALTRLQTALEAGLQDDAQAAQKELQAMDISNTRYLADQKNAFDLKMQTQDFDQQTKMTYLTDELASARANGDVDRQKSIIQFQTGQDIQKIAAESGANAALEKVRGDIQLALQNDDQVAVEALQRSELTFKAGEAAKDRMIEKAKVDLTAKQVDMAQVEQQYNQISDMVDQGILDPSAEYDFLMGTMKAHGVDTSSYKMVDAQAQAQKALQQEYGLQKQQYLITHPQAASYTVNKDVFTGKGNVSGPQLELYKQITNSGKTSFTANELATIGIPQDWIAKNTISNLTGDNLKGFNEFMNSTLYGELTAEEKKAKANAGYLGVDDISTATSGDKYNFEQPVSYNGKTIPVGKYSVKTNDVGHGNKFWGTAYTNTHKYLVNAVTGESYEIEMTKSGTTGNIISGLWADNGGL
jgi:hypothetical protein